MAVFILALAVLAWSGYHGYQTISAHRDISNLEAASAEQSVSQGRDRDYDIAAIIEAHLFGEVTEPVEEQTATAPETNLQIRLLGLVATSNQQLARAIIATSQSKVKPYSVGQTIDGTDASVYSVETNRVLLKRENGIESLYIRKLRPTDTSTNATTASIEHTTVPSDNQNNLPKSQSATAHEDDIRRRARSAPMNNPF